MEHPHSQGLSELRGLAGVHTCTGQLSLKQMSNIDANAGIIIIIIPYFISYHNIYYSTLGLILLPVTCCEHSPPSIATVHFSKFSIATYILFN